MEASSVVELYSNSNYMWVSHFYNDIFPYMVRMVCYIRAFNQLWIEILKKKSAALGRDLSSLPASTLYGLELHIISVYGDTIPFSVLRVACTHIVHMQTYK